MHDIAHDYPEHAEYENGNYYNTCGQCGVVFVGLKNTPVCKVCSERTKENKKREAQQRDYTVVRTPTTFIKNDAYSLGAERIRKFNELHIFDTPDW